MRVLLVKLTSLGDLIHALPALTDAHRVYPHLLFDWVIDEGFQEIGTFHPAVETIFTTNHRKWRHSWGKRETYRSISELVCSVRKKTYDVVIDGQGNFKSALIALFAKGKRVGFDKKSIREPIASFTYHQRYSISWQLHAIDRLRKLFSESLHYPLPFTPPDFAIREDKLKTPSLLLPSSFLVFVHSASWKTKLWPEEHWVKLIRQAIEGGHSILLPWGNEEEKRRAQRLVLSDQVTLLPKLPLSHLASLLQRAEACVSVDTGLSHLASALKTPCLTLYGSTDSGLIGVKSSHHINLQSTLPCAPCHKKQCLYPSQDLLPGSNPPCLAQITPERVFALLKEMLKKRSESTQHPKIPLSPTRV